MIKTLSGREIKAAVAHAEKEGAGTDPAIGK
jgi:hypothetical protein